MCEIKEISSYIADKYRWYEIDARYDLWTSVSVAGLPNKYKRDIFIDRPKKCDELVDRISKKIRIYIEKG